MFVATKTALLDALKLVGQVVEKRNTIPILQNVLFEEAGDGKLAARVTDLDTEATMPFAADKVAFRSFTVPAHLLSEIVRKLPDGVDVRLEADDEDLRGITIKAGRSKFRLPVLPASDFPSLSAGDVPHSFEVPVAKLASALAGVSFAISTEETRYYLNGIFVHPSEAGVKFVATDGHRLAKRFIPLDDPPHGMPGIILPKKTVETVARHLPKDGTVIIQASDAKVRIIMGELVLVSKLIDGTFPDYDRVIPDLPRFIELEGKALSTAIDRVSTVSSGKGNAVKMTFAEGLLNLSVSNPDAGNAEDDLPFNGEMDLVTGFNAKYVNDALSHLPEGTMLFHLGEPGSPALIRADGDHVENLVVLMPMRV